MSLYDDVMAARPKYNSRKEAIEWLTVDLELLAARMKLTVSELLHEAEHSPVFKEEYLEASRLARQIGILRKSKT